jgi:hypothetical protein
MRAHIVTCPRITPEAHVAQLPALLPHPLLRAVFIEHAHVLKEEAYSCKTKARACIEPFCGESQLHLEECEGRVPAAPIVIHTCSTSTVSCLLASCP